VGGGLIVTTQKSSLAAMSAIVDENMATDKENMCGHYVLKRHWVQSRATAAGLTYNPVRSGLCSSRSTKPKRAQPRLLVAGR